MSSDATPPRSANIDGYPRYVVLFNAFFWGPVFFLFFGEHVTLDEILRLEAIYYAAVVVLEVPSGLVSDRFGRKPALVASASALLAAYALFAVASSFAALATAQVLLATGIAFSSGTDVSFHYDALAEAGREAEFADREARVVRLALVSWAVTAVIGGAAGLVSLRLAYLLSGVAAAASLVVVLRFHEPRVHAAPPPPGARPVSTLRAGAGYLRQPLLAWLFAVSVVMVVLNHLPYEFYQPYIGLLTPGPDTPGAPAPLATGLHAAAVAVVAAAVAGRSVRVARRLGLRATVLSGVALQTVIIATMGLVLHPIVLALVLLRGVPRALLTAPVNAAIAPAVETRHRATYLSLQSLVGRLSFSGVLALLSILAGAGAPTWPTLSRLLLVGAAGGAVAWGLLLLTSRAAPGRRAISPSGRSRARPRT